MTFYIFKWTERRINYLILLSKARLLEANGQFQPYQLFDG